MIVFIHIEIRTNHHSENFALRLTLQERQRGTWTEWSILPPWLPDAAA